MFLKLSTLSSEQEPNRRRRIQLSPEWLPIISSEQESRPRLLSKRFSPAMRKIDPRIVSCKGKQDSVKSNRGWSRECKTKVDAYREFAVGFLPATGSALGFSSFGCDWQHVGF